ncbi:hypothetical protein TcBrA4_0018060 [Trypanosoma cruzi]|nr:hypothetical protein TcBrA4_0018060 [Trypanosoma cruzi]
MAITAICDAGDYALVPQPGFPHYETVCKAYGIGMHFYNCRPENDWEADLDEIRRLKDDKTKLLIVTNPSNPCGSNFSRKHVEDIVRLAEELRLPLFRTRSTLAWSSRARIPTRPSRLWLTLRPRCRA